jgi:predicted 3-demethylubiquinone-9 3-methyltransferase (glyoxalase superfamily)
MPGEASETVIRLVCEAEDVGEAFTPELRAREERLRAEVERQRTSGVVGGGVQGGQGMALKGRSKIYSHLWYATEAEEAARFYTSIFPDSRVDRVTPLLSNSPSGPAGSVKVVDFTLFGQRFQAISAGPHHEFNDAVSLVVLCDDQAELDRYWNALLHGGGKAQACGWLIDRFGLRWQIVPAILDELMRDRDAARSKRVTDAMLKMVKLDIAALEKANRA